MNNDINIINKVAKQIVSSLKHLDSYENLTAYANSIGYTVFSLGTASGNAAASKHSVPESRLCDKSFTWISSDARLIFINNNLSAESKRLCLLHELGHILLHTQNGHLISISNEQSEVEADAFTAQVLHLCKPRRKGICIALIVLSVFCAALLTIHLVGTISVNTYDNSSQAVRQTVAINDNFAADYVCITPTGKKYHRKDCRYISNASIEISKEEAEELNYSPCKYCY